MAKVAETATRASGWVKNCMRLEKLDEMMKKQAGATFSKARSLIRIGLVKCGTVRVCDYRGSADSEVRTTLTGHGVPTLTDPRQCHVTTGIVDRLSDGSYMLKPLKQKQYIDGLVFLLQEIYGIENKLVDNKVLSA